MAKLKLFFCVAIFGSVAVAELDNSSQEALEKTVKAMTNPTEREKAFQENPKFKTGEAGADMLVKGNEAQKQQLYEIPIASSARCSMYLPTDPCAQKDEEFSRVHLTLQEIQ